MKDHVLLMYMHVYHRIGVYSDGLKVLPVEEK